MITQEVPTLDLRDFDPSASREQPFVHALGRAFRELGFVSLIGHDVGAQLTEPAYAAARAFFALSTEQKLRYHLRGQAGARGYTPFRVETAKDALDPDLKEFWHVGRELDSREAQSGLLPNVWPEEVPQFRPAMLALYRALDQLGARVLSAIALDLELEARWFDAHIRHGNSILRPLHYPPLASGVRGVRSAAHEDINLITLLVGSGEPGLEILTRTGAWLQVAMPAGHVVVNVGDMLERLTNHVLPSTTHRVVNPPEPWASRARFSIPFFLHPSSEMSIETLSSCITPERPNRYPRPISADAFLAQRLREIGLA